MFLINPFALLSETVPTIFMQGFVIVMAILVIAGTLLDIIHKKNVKYFFENAKKAKLSAKKTLSSGEKISVISKTIISDIATTSELGAGKRRIAHLLGMYNFTFCHCAAGRRRRQSARQPAGLDAYGRFAVYLCFVHHRLCPSQNHVG